jgi:hypothetical protein
MRNEVDALSKLGATAVGDPVGGDEVASAAGQRVESAIEVLALPKPSLLGHVLAQVAADREGSVTGSGDDDDTDGWTDRNRLEYLLTQASASGDLLSVPTRAS